MVEIRNMITLSEIFLDSVKQDETGVLVLLDNELIVPAAKILFSMIDTMAAISRNENESHTSKHFLTFYNTYVKKYMAQNSGLAQDKQAAEKIYGYRCGMLHATVFESTISEKYKLKAEESVFIIGKNADSDIDPKQSYTDQIREHRKFLRKSFNIACRGLQSRIISEKDILNLHSFRYAIKSGMRDFLEDVKTFTPSKQSVIKRRIADMPTSVFV